MLLPVVGYNYGPVLIILILSICFSWFYLKENRLFSCPFIWESNEKTQDISGVQRNHHEFNKCGFKGSYFCEIWLTGYGKWAVFFFSLFRNDTLAYKPEQPGIESPTFQLVDMP